MAHVREMIEDFYPDGKLRSRAFICISPDGGRLPCGRWLGYYHSGRPKSFVAHRDGFRHGSEIEWYESGQIKFYCDWQFGSKCGYSMYFDETGALQTAVPYQQGVIEGVGLTVGPNGYEYAQFESGQCTSRWTSAAEDADFANSLGITLDKKVLQAKYTEARDEYGHA